MSSRPAFGKRLRPGPGLDLHAAGLRELVGPSVGHDLPVREDRDAVAHPLELAEQVRVDQHRDPAIPELEQQRSDRSPAGGIECARGLVEQQQLRLADERLRDPEPLLHPLGHPFDPAARDVAQSDELEQLVPLGLATG